MSGSNRSLPPIALAPRGGLYVGTIKPPFDFRGTVVKVFPLRAKLDRLQAFIDAYLNIVPEEVAEFRAFLPYVYLMFLHYGKMSLDAVNLGWIAQNEVLIHIPVLWYKRTNRGLVFHDFASVAPFVYVDHDHSLATGREVFGWPKDLVSVDTLTMSPWVKDPESNSSLTRYNAMVFPELYAGKRLASEPLFEIGHSEGASFSRFPFEPRAAWLPWVGLPKAITGSVNMMLDFVEILRGLGFLRQQRGAGPDAYAGMLAQLTRSLRFYSSELTVNTVNLKQFRDAESPGFAAYQGITNAPMIWRRIHRGGLLGERQIAQGDPSGGFSIDVYRHLTAPLTETLGLEVAAERTIDSRTVQTLRPLFPMWLEADLYYNIGDTIAWRGKDFPWHDDKGKTLTARPGAEECRFNTARGSAEAQIEGPFEFPSVTLRVMPLLADEDKLKTFLREYLGAPIESEGIEVLPWGNYVYLVAASYEEMSSAANDIGLWAERETAFYVPAKVMRWGRLWKVVLVPAFAFVNNATAALTGAEVMGTPTARAELTSPSDPWMEGQGGSTSTNRSLLSVSTVVLPAAGMGQEADERVILEIFEGDPIPKEDEERWRIVAQSWGLTLKDELRRKRGTYDEISRKSVPDIFTQAQALALQVLIGQRSIHFLTLKQFRDAKVPSTACYQALVEIDREITSVRQIQEIEAGLYVRIHRYPTHPIVDMLGLASVTEEVTSNGSFVHVLEPIRPFWIKASLREHLGKNLFVRAGSEAWRPSEKPGKKSPTPAPLPVEVVKGIELIEPRRLAEQVRTSTELRQKHATPEMIAEVVEASGPQLTIESILSEEWERWGACRWHDALHRIKSNFNFKRARSHPLDAALEEFDMFAKARFLFAHHADVSDYVWAYGEGWVYGALPRLLHSRLIEFFLLQYGLSNKDKLTILADELIKNHKERLLKLWIRFDPEQPSSDHEKLVFQLKEFKDEIERILKPHDDEWEKEIWRRKVETAESAEFNSSHLLMLMAKALQKPYFAIRRGTIANPSERDRMFPKSMSWGGEWYIEVAEGIEELNQLLRSLDLLPDVAL